MADIRATQSGDFSATTTWFGGVVPGAGDIAYANTFTVTISDSRTVQGISNATGTSITVGGTFSLLNGANLTCTNASGITQGAITTACVTTASLGIGTAIINSNISNGTSTTNAHLLTFSSAGRIDINGNISSTVSASVNASVIVCSGSGTLNINGSVTSSLAASTGSAPSLSVTGATTVKITGNVTAVGSASHAISMTAGNVEVNGTATGGSAAGNAFNNSGGTLSVIGTCISGLTSAAIGPGTASQVTRLSGPFLLSSTNINPVTAIAWRWYSVLTPAYYEVPNSAASAKRNLYTADQSVATLGYPAISNTRAGTVYGPNNEYTGTLAVPTPGRVSLNVATDNTVGTAILTDVDVRAALGLASSNLDTQLASKVSTDQVSSIVQGAVSA